MNSKEILVAARDRVANPYHWANDIKDHEFDYANCQCAATAIWNATERIIGTFVNLSNPVALEAGVALASAASIKSPRPGDWSPIYDWNDKSTHAEVMAAFDKAIEAA